MKTHELKAKRTDILAEARQITDAAEKENRDLNDEEREAFDAKMTEAQSLRARIERDESLAIERGLTPPDAPVATPDPSIGLTEREAKEFSFIRAINGAMSGKWENAGFEKECSDAAAAKQPLGQRGNIVIPHDVLVAPVEKRDFTVGTGTGDQLVATDHMAQNFIDLLVNKMVVKQAGATIMSGLVGDVAIPKHKTGTTAYWVAEDGAPTESASAMEQVTLSPKTVAAFEDLSRQLLQQSAPSAEAIVKNDIARTLAIAIDYAALHGSGSSNQPLGVIGITDVGVVTGGTNGANPDWSDLVDLESAVAVDNALLGNLSYMINPATRGFFKKTVRVSSTDSQFIWDGGSNPLNGYPVHVSNQISSTLTKGTTSDSCSAIFFGNWADLLIGYWGGLDLLVNPYTLSTTGQVRIVAFQSCDIDARNGESFAVMKDATLV